MTYLKPAAKLAAAQALYAYDRDQSFGRSSRPMVKWDSASLDVWARYFERVDAVIGVVFASSI